MRRILPLLFTLLVACSGGPGVNSDYNPAVDFTRYESFRLVRPAVVMPPETGDVDAAPINTIFDTIRDDLGSRPMVELDEGADLSVSVIVHVGEQTGSTRWGYTMDSAGDRIDGPSYEFREGTLVIDFFDSATNQLVWRGWAHGAVTRTGDYDLDLLARYVRAILAQFPPGESGRR